MSASASKVPSSEFTQLHVGAGGVNPHSEESKRKKDEPKSSSMMRGRQITASPSGRELMPFSIPRRDLAIGSLSLTDRLTLKVSSEMGVPFLDTSSPGFQIFTKMSKALEPMFDLLGKMEIPASVLINMGFKESVDDLEDDGRPLALVDMMSDQIRQKLKGQLAEVGVVSFSELNAKTAKLAVLKQKGAREFFLDPKNILLMRQGDEAMARAATGALSKKAEGIIEAYWALIAKDPHGHTVHAKTQSRFGDFFLDIFKNQESIPQMVSSFAEKGKTSSPVEGLMMCAKFLTQQLHAALQQQHITLKQERQLLTSETDKAICDYLLLLGELQGPALANLFARQAIEQLAQKHAVDVAFWVKLNQSSYDTHIAILQSQASEKAEIPVNKEEIDKRIAELRQQQREVPENTYKRMGHPDAIRGCAPQETEYELGLLQFMGMGSAMKVTQSASFFSFAIPELRLDIEKLSPEYFRVQMLREAQTKFELFTKLAPKFSFS